jgi:hypothetical protein
MNITAKKEVRKITKSYLRGHEIELVNGKWIYSDTKELTTETWQSRTCGHCGLQQTKEGHDGCLGTLKGIMNACCGHGQIKESYVQFLDGSTIHGKNANVILNILKEY